MKNFCTLFDSHYLFKGLALHASLLKTCESFHLWILCIDDRVYDLLSRMNLESVSLIALSDFEDEELLKAKATRSRFEYCCTCTPSLPLYILHQHPKLDMITYLDADLFFYSSPEPIFQELGDRSILIIEHRFPARLKWLEINGIYNVQMLIFRNNEEGLACLSWWRERCNEWCYLRIEEGKFGDQKYLDGWTTRFKGVHVLQHIGGGVALWNVMQYQLRKLEGIVFVDDRPLIFYHFHRFALLSGEAFDFGDTDPYPRADIKQKRWIYQPYIFALKAAIASVRKIDSSFNAGYTRSISKPTIFRRVFNKVKQHLALK